MKIENGDPRTQLPPDLPDLREQSCAASLASRWLVRLGSGGNDETESEWEPAEPSRGNRRDEREVDHLGGSRCAVDFGWCRGAGACRLRHASG